MSNSVATVSDFLGRVQATGEAICAEFVNQIRQLGIGFDVSAIAFSRADFEITPDPANGAQSLTGTWRDGRGYRLGSIVFNVDDSFYAEYDIAQPHPTDSRWFVEAVVAWGREGVIKSELRMLPAIG